MQYQVVPVGAMWQKGSFCVPTSVVDDHIRFASEYQIKALLIVLSTNGATDTRAVSKALACTEGDADEFLSYWVEQGVLSANGEVVAPAPVPSVPVVEKVEDKPAQKKVESLPVPTLTSKDIIDMCREDKALEELLRNAEEVLGKILSHVERQLIVNMNTYYGLPADVVLIILQYYKTERQNGRAIGNAYVSAMAKNWAEDGINTLAAADERLREIEANDRLWNEIVAMVGIRHKSPTSKQREMIKRWHDEFSIEMISLACDAMKENAQKPSLKYVDGVLKNWSKKGIKTPKQVDEDNERHQQRNTQNEQKIDKTYDIDDLEKRAMFNDNYDV